MEKKDVVTFKIKPKEGVTVKDPKTLEPLKTTGESKPRNTYWLRRVKDGDCTVVDTSTKQTTTKKDAK
ncbi:hypothetical protein A1QO_15450 [Vibrio genomosp. F10 str. ZF-129]|uniref:DUF2635 domain-containing protein n=1 Tax=Vibrio genomosp. F10 str. ZF-129 TaxID=1187848 RepID=A0A1E5BAX5_9VIBR|nr:DUF2635 domain-containing protein [Vibrio genomosp. F10]OEE30726.1 hypothetical protein A1QO_15450 [Vibrio genomosp. F10 str. ZF-129]